jgi:hypothetical protein
MREARDPELRELMKAKDYPALRKRIERIGQFHADPEKGFRRPGEDPPFASWFILDEPEGKVLAHPDEQVIGNLYRWRDYFQGAVRQQNGQAYVSRVYQAHAADDFYKFAIAVPIRDGKTTLGIIVATLTTGSAEETLLPTNAPQKAVLVGPWDGNPPPEVNPDIPTDLHPKGQPLIILHPAFDRGDQAVAIHNDLLLDRQRNDPSRPGMDGHYQDPVGEIDARFGGRWLAASAPVKHTEFVVIVQQDYATAVQPYAILGRPLMLWSAVTLVLLVTIGTMVWSVIDRMQYAT